MMTKIDPKPANATYNDEQWQAIQQRGSNILVAASAGSGKTTVLIERILMHIAKEYAGLDELLVVTFTEAAAREMKERMEISLKKAVSETIDSQTQQRLLHQVNLLPNAHIRTLHSFCLQVIQQFFYLIDVNPSFQLLVDETQKTLIYQEVWQDLLNDLLNEADNLSTDPDPSLSMEDLVDLLSRYSDARSDEALFDMVLSLYHFASSHPEPDQWLSEVHQISANFDGFLESELYQLSIKRYIKQLSLAVFKLLSRALEDLHRLSDESIKKYEPLLLAELEQVNLMLEYNQQNNLAAFMKTVQQANFARWPSNRKKTDDKEAINELKVLRDDAKKLVQTKLASIFDYDYEATVEIEATISPIIKRIGELTRMFSRYLVKHKVQLNIIDYNDLEHMTLNILAPYNQATQKREASPAAAYYQNLFKEVLVDEYQDINEIQAAILGWLAHDNRPELPGNLFMVGDVKQSIYGFRMAEPSLFLNKYKSYQQSEQGVLIVLDKNYRSRDEVLQFTNFVFERLMDETFGEMTYGLQESLKTGNHSLLPPSPDEDFNIELLLYEKEQEEEAATVDSLPPDWGEADAIETSIEAEAHLIAQDIQSKIADGFQIYDKSIQAMRLATFKDFVILSATRSPFLPVQQVFEEYHLPVFTQKVESYFQRQEVRLMIALLKLIDNPLQDIPLVAILRSYFVGLTDEALSQVRIEHPNGLFYSACLAYIQNHHFEQVTEEVPSESQTIANQLQHFFKQLNSWRELSAEVTLVEVIWTIYQETYFLDYVAGLANGTQRQANLHAFYEKAAAFEDSSFKGLFGFVNYIEKVMQQDNDLAEPVILAEDQNMIRMMTVHASKGLEFPVVYLMNTAKRFNLSDVSHKPYIASKHYGIGTDLYDYEHSMKYHSLTKEALKIDQTNLLKAEEMRKLYVALTRCEQKLIIVGSIKNEADWLTKSDKTRQMTDKTDILIDTQERQSANNWLEWIRQSLAVNHSLHPSVTHFDKRQVTTRFINEATLQLNQVNEAPQTTWMTPEQWQAGLLKQVKNTPSDLSPLVQQINQLMTTTYGYRLATRTSSYQSVSELKRLYEEPQIEKIRHFEDRRPSQAERHKDHTLVDELLDQAPEGIQGIRYTQDTFVAPRFIEDKLLDFAQIGTIHHFFMQQLDFSALVALDKGDYEAYLLETANQLVADLLITAEEAKQLQFHKLVTFLCSELGQIMLKHHRGLKREKAFSYLIPAQQLFETQLEYLEIEELSDNQLLVHGIIDNYFKTEEGIIILDYKTDRFKPFLKESKQEQQALIVEKYKFQISLYASALESATQQHVIKAYLVLLDFEEVILVDDLYPFNRF